jgi:3-dehydroquinate dehydratase
MENLTKEQQIIQSILLSDFHWVDIEGDTKKELLKYFIGNVSHKGKYKNILSSHIPLKKWDKIEDCQEWLPNNILHKSFASFEFDKFEFGYSLKSECYVKDINKDT